MGAIWNGGARERGVSLYCSHGAAGFVKNARGAIKNRGSSEKNLAKFVRNNRFYNGVV